jgi:hypothetical protein
MLDDPLLVLLRTWEHGTSGNTPQRAKRLASELVRYGLRPQQLAIVEKAVALGLPAKSRTEWGLRMMRLAGASQERMLDRVARQLLHKRALLASVPVTASAPQPITELLDQLRGIFSDCLDACLLNLLEGPKDNPLGDWPGLDRNALLACFEAVPVTIEPGSPIDQGRMQVVGGKPDPRYVGAVCSVVEAGVARDGRLVKPPLVMVGM